MSGARKKVSKFETLVAKLEAKGPFTSTLLASALPHTHPSEGALRTARQMVGGLGENGETRINRLACLLDELVIADAEARIATKKRKSA